LELLQLSNTTASASEMTYIVSGGALNSTHSLAFLGIAFIAYCVLEFGFRHVFTIKELSFPPLNQ